MTLDEAEIQVLATLRKAELEALASDRASLEREGDRFWRYLEDWSRAYGSLQEKGLIDGDDAGYRLTESARPRADAYHRERPDHYWYYYQHFYIAAHESAAHSRHCERVYGEDLCQEGQMDMRCLHELLALLDLQPGDAVLDLGCGAGAISEYISDMTGAAVKGVDYAASAIAAAEARTEAKRVRLGFREGDLNALDLSTARFDAAIMIDTHYWVTDLDACIATIVESLKEGGQLAIVVTQDLRDGGERSQLEADGTPVARSLTRLGLACEVYDQTEAFRDFWPRVKASMVALRDAFEAEGNGIICDALEREADEHQILLDSDAIRRFIYHVRR